MGEPIYEGPGPQQVMQVGPPVKDGWSNNGANHPLYSKRDVKLHERQHRQEVENEWICLIICVHLQLTLDELSESMARELVTLPWAYWARDQSIPVDVLKPLGLLDLFATSKQ